MNIGLCAAFLEEDIWETIIRELDLADNIEITQGNGAQALLPALHLKHFSLVVVVLNGSAGLEAVRHLREKASDVPILWISDEDYSLNGYQYRVTCFLRKPVSPTELKAAMAVCLNMESGCKIK